MARPSTVSAWISENIAVAVGGFLSGTFLLVGVLGTLAFLPNLRAWVASPNWPATEAEITASRLVYSTRGRTARPDFTFRYTWEGTAYTAHGYDLLAVYTTGNYDSAQALAAAHPIGSRTTVLVNPAHPSQAVLHRGSGAGLIIYLLPPFFAVLGLIGGMFSLAGGLGLFDENSRHPIGRVFRVGGGWLLQEKILKRLFFVIFGGVILGLAVWGVMTENLLLVLVAGFFLWGGWKAARPPKR